MKPATQFDLCPWGKLIAMPHMGWQHAGWFASYVVAAKNILEWGSGGCTLWMAQMRKPKAVVVSIEHDRGWLDRVSMKLLQSPDMYQAHDVVLLDGAKTPPYTRPPYAEKYVPYDLIFVDGIERPACLEASYDLLAPGGVVFLHDSQRAQYTKAKRQLLEREGMTLIDERRDPTWVNTAAGMWAVQKG